MTSVSEGKCCYDCRFWCGRCLKGRKNVLASNPACEDLELWPDRKEASK